MKFLLIDLREPIEIKNKPSLLNSINIPYSVFAGIFEKRKINK